MKHTISLMPGDFKRKITINPACVQDQFTVVDMMGPDDIGNNCSGWKCFKMKVTPGELFDLKKNLIDNRYIIELDDCVLLHFNDRSFKVKDKNLINNNILQIIDYCRKRNVGKKNIDWLIDMAKTKGDNMNKIPHKVVQQTINSINDYALAHNNDALLKQSADMSAIFTTIKQAHAELVKQSDMKEEKVKCNVDPVESKIIIDGAIASGDMSGYKYDPYTGRPLEQVIRQEDDVKCATEFDETVTEEWAPGAGKIDLQLDDEATDPIIENEFETIEEDDAAAEARAVADEILADLE